MTRYFNIDRYRRQKYGLISIHILVFDTNTNYMQYKFLQTHQLKIRDVKKCFVSSGKQTTRKHFGTKGKLEHLCFGQTILIVTDNTTIVYCINKEGSMRSGSVPSSGGSSPAASSDR